MQFVSKRSSVYSIFSKFFVYLLIILAIEIITQRIQVILNTRKLASAEAVVFEKWWLNEDENCWGQYAGWLYQLPDCSLLEVGDKVRLVSKPVLVSDNDQFSEKSLEIQSISLVEFSNASVNAWVSKSIRLVNWIKVRALRYWRRWLGFSGGSLVYSLWFGGRSVLSKKMELGLENLGLAYLVSVSGMHVGLVRGWYDKMLAKQPIGRQLLLESAVLGVFGSFALWRPGVLRAVSMAFLRLVGKRVLGKAIFGPSLLFTAVCLSLLLKPLLWFEVGFWLSVAATFGILWTSVWFRNTNRFVLWEMGATALKDSNLGWWQKIWRYLTETWQFSLAAQIATLPILINVFAGLSWVSLFASIAALWLMPPLFKLGGWLIIFLMIRIFISDQIGAAALDFVLAFLFLPLRLVLELLADFLRAAAAQTNWQIEFSVWSTWQILIWYLFWILFVPVISRLKNE